MNVLITGAAGFIGSNFIRHMVVHYPTYHFINYDKLTYAGNLDNVEDLTTKPNYTFMQGDVCDINLLCEALVGVDCVIHFAAESHVDNSINYQLGEEDPGSRTLGNSLEFTKTNVLGTHTLLEAAKHRNVKLFIHISTDEVYGDILEGSAHESDPLRPNNPYSASKAAAEMIVQGHHKTYKTPVIIVRGNNVYGPYQYPEKIIPRFITNLILHQKLPVHGRGENIRTYIHVDDMCRAIETIFLKGKIGETYNLGTKDEISNLELAHVIARHFGKTEDVIEFVRDRPHNDRRYSVNTEKIHALGWKQQVPFQEGITQTIQWYNDHPRWWKRVLAHWNKTVL